MQTVEYITDELCRIVGHGPGPHRLALMPQLVRVAGALEMATPIQSGSLVASHVRRAIIGIEEPIYFDGMSYDPVIARRCFLVLLGYEATGQSAPSRRMLVIQNLGHYYGLETWRKKLERQFINILAEIIYSGFNPNYQIAKPLPAHPTNPAYC